MLKPIVMATNIFYARNILPLNDTNKLLFITRYTRVSRPAKNIGKTFRNRLLKFPLSCTYIDMEIGQDFAKISPEICTCEVRVLYVLRTKEPLVLVHKFFCIFGIVVLVYSTMLLLCTLSDALVVHVTVYIAYNDMYRENACTLYAYFNTSVVMLSIANLGRCFTSTDESLIQKGYKTPAR